MADNSTNDSVTIFKLTKKFKRALEDFGATYSLGEGCYVGMNKRIYGRHCTVYLPRYAALSKVSLQKLKETVERFHGKVRKVLPICAVSMSGKELKEITYIFEEDE